MSRPAPLVSVVIPTHYRNDRLAAAIESVRAQTYEPIEVLVVDDSGERHAEPVAEAYDVPYLGFDENRGSNVARTVGTRRTSGTYLQYLDDDDRLHPRKLERQVALLENAPDAGVAYCGMEFEDGGTVRPDPAVRGDVLDAALSFDLYPCQTTTMLADREVVEATLPWKNRPGADDFGRMLELARLTEFEFLDEPLVVRGVIPDSRGKSMGVFHGRLEIVREYEALYDEHPSLREEALAKTHRFRAEKLLEDAVWSPAATASYARAAWYGRDATTGGRAVASSLGRPGLRLAGAAYGRLS
ncbi:Glycosyl transferase, family 2:Polysaccharide deacetylase [Halorubrum sp. DM2]|uniref:glycosyltransferase family 2 protein n=1 Tax=Halorubrum sp. DM2 TaxID=2527867 RepID=UPI0024B63E10|nr:glycosyltransferase family 2 protein [Halorubrum sp. DM2]VTT88052.1 Glycosyl transferase, family 2:Polysaccharide deacetylase [Halorubrum sp. DM2]